MLDRPGAPGQQGVWWPSQGPDHSHKGLDIDAKLLANQAQALLQLHPPLRRTVAHECRDVVPVSDCKDALPDAPPPCSIPGL